MCSNAASARVAIHPDPRGSRRDPDPQSFIAAARGRSPALEKDRQHDGRYLAQFRTDVEGFVALEVVEACTGDYREMLPAINSTYRAFYTGFDGGSDDSFALAISHKSHKDRIVIDVIREARPPFSPDAVVDDFAALPKSYRVGRMSGDRCMTGSARAVPQAWHRV